MSAIVGPVQIKGYATIAFFKTGVVKGRYQNDGLI
jgi:hypothetical protein